MYKRLSQDSVNRINNSFRVLLLTGPRQVGKTTLLKNLMPSNMNYVSLDNKRLRDLAKSNPDTFLEEHPWPLFIDEAQYAPELFPYIKMRVDEFKERGMYWLTGSQQFNLMKDVQESLAGRVGIISLNSFTFKEVNNNCNAVVFNPDKFQKEDNLTIEEVFNSIFKGGMPELYDIPNMGRKDFFSSYIDTYITRDVVEQTNITNIELFKNFMVSVAFRTGEQLNYTNIAKELKISDNTVRAWLNILITSGIVYLLPPLMNSKLKRITHMPKIIFMDTGLCSYLAGWEDAKELQMSDKSGHYLETFIISEIVKSYNAIGKELNISYYRDKEKNEIDLVFFKNDKYYPFEIKKTKDPNPNMIKNFNKLTESGKSVEPGGIICFFDHLMHLDDKNYIIPISSVINLK